jgi:DNA-binding GntR family transcriptional regulator
MKKRKPLATHRSRSASVATRLRKKILSGELHDGDQLHKGGLASEFDLREAPVKQAIRQLEAEGLVKTFAHRGAVVSALSSEEIGELFEIRGLLECEVLRLSIPYLTEGDLDKADSVLNAFDKALLHDRDARVWGRMNAHFHSALYIRANRPHFLSLIEMINNHGERYTRLQLYLTRGFERAREEHRMLLDLCRKRDVDAACTLLDAHIRHAGLSLKDYLGSQRGNLQSRAV